jgi:serine/threonine protein kinase
MLILPLFLPQANILVDENCTAHLADFGLIKVSETQGYTTTTKGGSEGTVRWMSPELLDVDEDEEKTGVSGSPEHVGKGGEKSRASDVYALGMTILEVIDTCRSVSSG